MSSPSLRYPHRFDSSNLIQERPQSPELVDADTAYAWANAYTDSQDESEYTSNIHHRIQEFPDDHRGNEHWELPYITDEDMSESLDEIFTKLDQTAAAIYGDTSKCISSSDIKSEVNFSEMKEVRETRKFLYPKIDALPLETRSDAINLAEACEEFGSRANAKPGLITLAAVDYMRKNGYSDDFVYDFEARRRHIIRTHQDVKKLYKIQEKCSDDVREDKLDRIADLIAARVNLNASIRELERGTRDLDSMPGLERYRNKHWYNAIVYYLTHHRTLQEAALYRRLRSDHVKTRVKA